MVLNVTNETADIIAKKLLINYAINNKYDDVLTDDHRVVLRGHGALVNGFHVVVTHRCSRR